MNRLLLTTLAFTATLCFNGCSRSEKDAVEEFKKDTTSLKTWADEQEKGFKADPMAPIKMMKEMVSKMKAVRTDGLPADLKDPWTTIVDDMSKMATITADMPTDLTKIGADPAMMQKMQDIQKKMMEVGPKLEADGKKMAEAAKKYGIEGMDKIGGPK
jgi:hypothetical protein